MYSNEDQKTYNTLLNIFHLINCFLFKTNVLLWQIKYTQTLDNNEVAMKNGQSVGQATFGQTLNSEQRQAKQKKTKTTQIA